MEKKEDKLKWEDVESAIDNLCKEDLKIWISDLLYLPEELVKAREEELEWILKNCSGGGNWRRIVNQRLSKLNNK